MFLQHQMSFTSVLVKISKVLGTGLSSMKLRMNKICGVGITASGANLHSAIQGLQRELLTEVIPHSSSAVRNSEENYETFLSDTSEFNLSATRQISLGLLKL
jgi:hypothetical protein